LQKSDTGKESGELSNFPEFCFDNFTQVLLIFHDPVRQEWRVIQPPGLAVLLHGEHNTVTPVVTDIDSYQSFIQAGQFSEIEFPQTAFRFEQFRELNITDEINMHTSNLSL
jgi:hypothetical protein